MNVTASGPMFFSRGAFSWRGMVAVLCVAAIPVSLCAHEASVEPGVARADTCVSGLLLRRPLHRLDSSMVPRSPRGVLMTRTSLPTDTDLSMRASLFALPPRKLSRIDHILYAADRGMELGLFLGAAGTTVGVFDEHTAWWLSGAMAVLSAILGDTGSTTPRGPVHVQAHPAP